MSDETYNGWTNRETWAVALHINNDQGWQESVRGAIKAEIEDWAEDLSWSPGIVEPSLTRNRARQAGEVIRESIELWLEDLRVDGNVTSDQWSALQDIGSLWRVNWTELGASFLADLEDN